MHKPTRREFLKASAGVVAAAAVAPLALPPAAEAAGGVLVPPQLVPLLVSGQNLFGSMQCIVNVEIYDRLKNSGFLSDEAAQPATSLSLFVNGQVVVELPQEVERQLKLSAPLTTLKPAQVHEAFLKLLGEPCR